MVDKYPWPKVKVWTCRCCITRPINSSTKGVKKKIKNVFIRNNNSDHNIYQVYQKMYIFYSETSLIYLSQYDLKGSLTWENAFDALRLSYTTSLSLAITLRSTHTPELHKITQKACNIMIYRCLEDTDCVEPGSWGVGVHNSPRLSLTNAAPKISTRRKGGWKNPHQCKWDPRTWRASVEEKKPEKKQNIQITCFHLQILLSHVTADTY